MWRTLAAAVIVYAYGHSAFDGLRPGVLDHPLQAFHAAANDAAREGQRALIGLEHSRAKQHLKTYVDRIESELRPGSQRTATAQPGE